jgi:hypothetical protein
VIRWFRALLFGHPIREVPISRFDAERSTSGIVTRLPDDGRQWMPLGLGADGGSLGSLFGGGGVRFYSRRSPRSSGAIPYVPQADLASLALAQESPLPGGDDFWEYVAKMKNS